MIPRRVFLRDGGLAVIGLSMVPGFLVRTLAQAYNDRPVTLTRMIYALRDPKIQSFADAFKLRKD